VTRLYTQDEVDARSRELIARQLHGLVDGYDGSDSQAKEILRGLVAARQMNVDLREILDALSRLGTALDAP